MSENGAPPQAPTEPTAYRPLRAMGVIDADDNLDCWDTAPFDLANRHVTRLNEKDPRAGWRVMQLYVSESTAPQAPAEPADDIDDLSYRAPPAKNIRRPAQGIRTVVDSLKDAPARSTNESSTERATEAPRALTDEPVIDYFVLHEFSERSRCDYNELCTAVRKALAAAQKTEGSGND